ncbi:exo-alpha-sialidase, partial [Rhodococcus sp. CX]|uniref:sialidase family protein n=1 Tax=Rhodococcus sp. CX TaxID=2789880 RepID=UPI0018CE530C
EINVTNDPTRLNGQPVIAVNPANPNNVVYISANHIPSTALPGEVGEFQCYSAFSNDGGKNWTRTEFPNGDRPFCGDPNLAVDSAGTFYTAFNRLGCPGTTDLWAQTANETVVIPCPDLSSLPLAGEGTAGRQTDEAVPEQFHQCSGTASVRSSSGQ